MAQIKMPMTVQQANEVMNGNAPAKPSKKGKKKKKINTYNMPMSVSQIQNIMRNFNGGK